MANKISIVALIRSSRGRGVPGHDGGLGRFGQVWPRAFVVSIDSNPVHMLFLSPWQPTGHFFTSGFGRGRIGSVEAQWSYFMTWPARYSDRSHFNSKLSSHTLSQAKGRVAVPKQMNFRKSSKGGGLIFNPKIYIADLGTRETITTLST